MRVKMLELIDGLVAGIAISDDDGGGSVPKKYGVDVNTFMGNIDSNGMILIPQAKQDIVLSGVKSVAAQGLMYKFYNCQLNSFSAPDLEQITTGSACEGCFFNSGLTSASMPKLQSIGGYNSCYQMFRGSSFETIEITASAINGNACCNNMFERCLKLKILNLTNLSNVSGQTNQFHNMLLGCSGVTVHLPSNLQSTMSGWQDVIDGFGGTNTTVLFDL